MTITAAPFNLTDVDRQVLAQTDDKFILHDWDDLKSIIGTYEGVEMPVQS